MGVCLNLFLIALCCVLVDVSGFFGEIEVMLAKWLKVNSVKLPKPIGCALCETHWIGLFYLLFSGHITLAYYAILLGMSVLTTELETLVWQVKDTIGLWMNFIHLLITGKKY